ncbi:Alpha,alpha-trehalose phosphorylase [Planococcus massiliensis]|uniref:Alpha,alpha-trehalose phosphorylase n=1 Tax=Planococcus massiliensis TaxID=1499687 RepID=A0A098EQS1_9BACL|nr:glycosyl hydrolase family 65 protein [Planococcus massiliensis]CEG23651.1 Alpha,alpha-trehalose phosphorylase [Planococcus massiliensis]
MVWKLTKNEVDNHNLLLDESILSLGNGYLGVRGNFEEGYPETFSSIRGTYINAFHDETEITYGEKLYGYPVMQQKILNVIDSQGIEIYFDDEKFSVFEGELFHFERNLHMDQGFAERIVHWKSPKGREAKLHFKRIVSFITRELFAQEVTIEAIQGIQEVKIVSSLEGEVTNFVDLNDPRVASGHAKRLDVIEVRSEDAYNLIKDLTYVTELEVACISSSHIEAVDPHYSKTVGKSRIEEVYVCASSGEPIRFTKYNIYTDSLRHGDELVEVALPLHEKVKLQAFDDLVAEQGMYMARFWKNSDVVIEGDEKLQEGIRFNLYQLLQSVGKDPYSNIAAKGLSGEGYEGHYFWDTEIFMFPVFLMTNPEIAKNLLLHRYSILDSARARAKVMGHEKGALFPWRTINGPESSAFFPAGTAQYHISADIAYSYIQYYLVTKDEEFLQDYMAEMLFETARLWVDTGHFHNNQFKIDSVTGPDEYTCVVNNNYYTNKMAQHNLLWAEKVYRLLEEKAPSRLEEVAEKLELTEEEAEKWKEAGGKMYLPYHEELKIHAQDDSFLQKSRWDLEKTPADKFPLLLHYHPLTLYRYQVCKQADTVLAHFLLEDDVDEETLKNSYDYYEEITTHDSSLSYSVFSIMASKLGYQKRAYDYFRETARLDLDNTHGNTKDGLHMANMGGTWLAIVYGFAGLRVKETGLYLNPMLPEQWQSFHFHFQYLGRLINIHIEKDAVSYELLEGDELTIWHRGEAVALKQNRRLQVR